MIAFLRQSTGRLGLRVPACYGELSALPRLSAPVDDDVRKKVGACRLLPLAHAGPSEAMQQQLRGAASRADYHATTVLCVRKDDQVVVMADGQVTLGSQVIKPNVLKVRKLGENVIGGFAGTTTDAVTLFERLESRLEEHPGQLKRAAVELAKAWRTDKFLRRLDAVMVVADKDISLQVSGNGDVLEPHDGIIAIGSGGSFALAAARALIDVPGMDAEAIAKKSMTIAADCCIYTNHNFKMEKLSSSADEA